VNCLTLTGGAVPERADRASGQRLTLLSIRDGPHPSNCLVYEAFGDEHPAVTRKRRERLDGNSRFHSSTPCGVDDQTDAPGERQVEVNAGAPGASFIAEDEDDGRVRPRDREAEGCTLTSVEVVSCHALIEWWVFETLVRSASKCGCVVRRNLAPNRIHNQQTARGNSPVRAPCPIKMQDWTGVTDESQGVERLVHWCPRAHSRS
jgi:hypothetical protein